MAKAPTHTRKRTNDTPAIHKAIDNLRRALENLREVTQKGQDNIFREPNFTHYLDELDSLHFQVEHTYRDHVTRKRKRYINACNEMEPV